MIKKKISVKLAWVFWRATLGLDEEAMLVKFDFSILWLRRQVCPAEKYLLRFLLH